jgi:hypothetical protein
MKASRTAHRVAAVVVVVFVLTTIWAGYSLYEEAHQTVSALPTGVATYSEGATSGFVAALKPSSLYNNSTEIVGGNITLFSPITSWINVTTLYSISTNRTASISLQETFTAVLSTDVWSKTLFATTYASSDVSTQILSEPSRYAVNVSGIVGLVTAIDLQIGYSPSSYWLTLSPAILGSVSAGGFSQEFALDPLLNFTFHGGLITPTGLSYSSNGTIYGPASRTSMDPVGMVALYLGLGASVTGIVAGAWVLARPREEITPPLEELIAPYEEAIAETAAAPQAEVTIPVQHFPDLAKIADTLGKPILRPKGAEAERPEFIVLDGWIAYSYQHPSPGDIPAGRPPAPAGGRVPTPPGAHSAALVVRRIQNEADRLRGLKLDEATHREVLRRIRRAIDLVHAMELLEADMEVDELCSVLDRAELWASRIPPG